MTKQLPKSAAKIDETIPDVCPDCGSSPHDVNHLFICPAHLTNLTALDLWNHPVEAAEFLNLTNDDDNDD